MKKDTRNTHYEPKHTDWGEKLSADLWSSAIAPILDTPSLGALAQCSSRLFNLTKKQRIKVFFTAMREGDIQRVIKALDAFNITNDNLNIARMK